MVIRILGYVLLGVAVILGLYFLFEFLVPIIGYIHSGALFTLFFAVMGLLLIFLSRRKHPRPIDNVIEGAEKIIKDLDIDTFITENGYRIILFSFVGGLVLSGMKSCKKDTLNNICDLLKTISHFKKY